MNVEDYLKKISNKREYEDKNLDDDLLKEILRVTKKTSSAANVQPWEIIVVRENKEKIVDCTLDPLLRNDKDSKQKWILEVPIALLVCIDKKRAKVRFGNIGENLFAIQDASILIQNIRLKAIEKGLSTCLLRELDFKKLRKKFDMPEHIRPISVVLLGYSSKEIEIPPSFELNEFIHKEKWGETFETF